MKDQSKTKQVLIQELVSLRHRISELERSESERKRVDEQILVTRERLQYLLLSISAVIYAAKPSGDYGTAFVSENVARMVGYNPAEFIRDSSFWFDHIHPEDQPIISEEVPKIFEKEFHAYEYRFRCKDGRYIWMSDQMKLVRDNDGNPMEIIGFWLDITERKRAEEALLESEARFKELYDMAPVGYQEYDTSGRITRVNQTDLDILGYSREEMIGQYIWKINRDEVAREQILAKLAGELPSGKQLERTYIRKDGTLVPVLIEDRLITDERGKIKGIRCTVQDITGRKRIEAETAALADIGRLIGSTLEIDEVYERFAADVRNLIPFDRLAINLCNLKENTLRVAYVSGTDIDHRKRGDSTSLAGTLSDLVVREQTSRIIRSDDIDEIVSRIPALLPTYQAGLRSLMAIPLVYRDEIIGVLHFRSKTPNAYIEQDLLLAERIGAQIAGAIGTAQLFSDLKKAEKSLRESEGRFRALVAQAAVGVAEIEMSTGSFLMVNRRLCEMVGRTEEELLATTFQAITHPEDLRLHEEKTALLAAGKIRHYSLEKRYRRKDGEIVWVNITVSPLWKPGKAPERNMVVVEDITNRTQMEEVLRDSEKRYRELSIVDDLTQLYNSRHFYVQLKIELDRSNRYEQPLTLLLLDLDNFKTFNDNYGHVEGDQVLSRLGQVFKRCLRETDFAYRYGGEEFTILLPMTTSADGAVTAERIRAEFKKETFSPAPGQDVNLTLSIGLAQYNPQEEMKVFVHRVDQLMYQGKKNGKDRVCSES